MQGNTLRANFPLRFVLLPLVDAHLPAPASPPRAPHCARAAPGQPSHQTQSGPARPQEPLPHHQPQEHQVFHLLCCDISSFGPESGRSSHKTQHTQSRPPAPTHTHRYSLPPTGSRQHSPAPTGVSKVVCCDIWILGRVWGPICEISQHSTCQTTEIPNYRSVTWFTHKFDAPHPRDVCCDIACFGPRFISWREISQHTSLDCRLRGAYG